MAARDLLCSRNFLLLQSGQFVSDLGGSFSSIAVPAAIILTLHASAFQVGALEAVSTGVIPLSAMAAGVVADRFSRKPLLVATNLVRLAALLAIPTAFALGCVHLWLFFAIAAIVGGASCLFDMAYAGLLPRIVGEAQIAPGVARLATGSAIAEVAGNGLAGALVLGFGAPFVILLDACSFLYSAVALGSLRVDEPPRSTREPRCTGAELRAGIAAIFSHAALRRTTCSDAVAHFGGGMSAAVATVFLYRDVHLSPVLLGLVLGVCNVGALAALFADRLAKRFGLRRTLVAAHIVSGAGKAALPLLAGMFPLVALAISRMLLTAAGPVFAVNDASQRMSLVPDALRGRATATARTIVWTALPIGSLAGGALGERIGLSATMLIGAAITASAAVVCNGGLSRGLHRHNHLLAVIRMSLKFVVGCRSIVERAAMRDDRARIDLAASRCVRRAAGDNGARSSVPF